MPTKPNHSGQQQEYVPAGNGDASGEYADNATGSNVHFKSFKKPEKDINFNIKIDRTKKDKNGNIATIEDNYNFISENSTFTKSIKQKIKSILEKADKDSVELLNNAYNKLDYKIKFRIGSGVYSRFREYLKTDKQDFEENGKYGIQGATWFHENGHLFDNVMSGNHYGWLSSNYKNSDGKSLNDIATEELQNIYNDKNIKSFKDIKQKYIDEELKKFDDKRYNELREKKGKLYDENEAKYLEHYKLFADKKISYEEYKKRIKEERKLDLSNDEEEELIRLYNERAELSAKGANNFYSDYCTISDLFSSKDGVGFGIGHDSSYYDKDNKLRGIELFANLFSSKAVNKKEYENTKKYFPKSVKMFEEIIDKYGK